MKYSLIGAAIIAGSVMTAAAPANERRTTIPQSGVSTSVTQIRSEDQTSGHYSKPNGGKAIVKKEAYLSGDNKQVSRSVLGAKGK